MSDGTTARAVRTDVDADGICTLTMDLPGRPMNVIGAELMPALAAAVAGAVADERVTGIVIASGKPAFVAGADLKQIDAGNRGPGPAEPTAVEERLDALLVLSRELRRLETCGKPVACAINGTALGGGFEIALACHYRVVVDDPAVLLGLPEANVGLLPGGGGTQRLIRLVGVARGLPMMLQGRPMNPHQALREGLVHAVVPRDRLLAEAKRLLVEEGDPVAPWDKKGFVLPGGGVRDKAVRGVFSATNTMLRANTFGNLPAPAAIAAVVYEGARLPMDAALRVEGKYFLRLMEGPVSKALITTMFVNKGKADKLDARPPGVPPTAIARIGVLGADTVGAGLALAAAKAGLGVVLLDRDPAAAEAGKEYAAERLARDVGKGRRTEAKARSALDRITPTASYDDLRGLPIVIEAVPGDPGARREAVCRAAEVLGPDAVFASTSAAAPPTGAAAHSPRPEQFLGMRFFAPAERTPLVEIARGRATCDAALAAALDLVAALRKTPVVVRDGPGFATSRLIGAFTGAGRDMVAEGIGLHLVENSARMLGMLAGPVATAGPHGSDPGGAPPAPLPAQPSADEVKQRLLYAQLVEATRCFAEGVLTSAIDGDLGATLGAGFPAYLGGPFTAVDAIGVEAFVAEADRLAAAYGARYAVPGFVRDMAGRHTFHGPKAVPVPDRRPDDALAGGPRT